MPNLDLWESLMNRQNDIVEEKVTIPSEIRYVREISSKILKKLKTRKIDKSILFDIRLCVEEVVRNAIEHGNKHDKQSKVRIEYRIKDDKFIIDVEDEGAGFDYKSLPDPTHEDNIMKGSGRGVYLVRHLMDKAEFNDKGNKVRLTKYI
jgi:serine/threonine-protein kinase RsbW